MMPWLAAYAVTLLSSASLDETRGTTTPPNQTKFTLDAACRFSNGTIVNRGVYDLNHDGDAWVLSSGGEEALRLPGPADKPADLRCEKATLDQRSTVMPLAEQPASAPAATALAPLADAAMAKRLHQLLDNCSDKARRRGYRLDDGRYDKCVCPLIGKLKYPPSTHFSLRLDRFTQVDVTVSASGRAVGCELHTPSAQAQPGSRP